MAGARNTAPTGRRRGMLSLGGACILLSVTTACEDAAVPTELRVIGGDPQAGRAVIASYDCGVCHTIPGVRGARGTVGPPLTAFGRRTLIAGSLPNRPDMLVRWIRDPPALEPDTAMPSMGVSEQEARHIAAYLYTLR